MTTYETLTAAWARVETLTIQAQEMTDLKHRASHAKFMQAARAAQQAWDEVQTATRHAEMLRVSA